MANFRFKFEDSEAPEILQHLQKDINLAARKGDVETVKRLLEYGADANYKDIYGRTPLHYAANDGHTLIVNILLKHGADVTLVTNRGSTPLHTASYKGYKDIVQVLLGHISRDKLNAFVNAKDTTTGNTSLHVAAKHGYLEVAKTFLKHGATYNSENSEGKIPRDLSEDKEVTDLLMLTEEMFRGIKNGNLDAVSKLRRLKTDEFFAVTNARDRQGNTLFQVAIANKHENIADKMAKIQKICVLDHLKRVKYAAELQIIFSDLYIPMLKRISLAHCSEEKALEQGSYYLQNAHHLVEVYRDCVPGSIDDENIKSVNDMLVELEFDPKHVMSEYSDESCVGMREYFVSKGQGTKYYKLLCSELKEDIREFIDKVEINIDNPVKRYLVSTKRRLECEFSE